jgi:NAD+ synthase (glutamine-hydrolysing)
VLCNLSASNIVIGKAREREMLCAAQSARAVGLSLFRVGPGREHHRSRLGRPGLIYELGELLAQSERFELTTEIVYADLDLERLRLERMRNGTFNDCAAAAGHPETRFRRIAFAHQPDFADRGLMRPLRRFPFVPNTPSKLEEDCYEAFNIQVEGLRKRVAATGASIS